MAKAILGENSPQVTFATGNGGVTIVSKFIPRFLSINDFMKAYHIPQICLPYSCIDNKDGSITALNGTEVNNGKELMSPIIEGMEMVSIAMYILGYGDNHFFNIGVRDSGNNIFTASLIDYDQCFDEAKEYTRYIKHYNKAKIIAGIEQVLLLDANQMLNSFIEELVRVYGINDSIFTADTDQMKKYILTKIASLSYDKEILEFIVSNQVYDESQVNNLVSRTFAHASADAKFELCSLYKMPEGIKCSPSALNLMEYGQLEMQLNEAVTYREENKLNELLQVATAYPELLKLGIVAPKNPIVDEL